MELQVGVKVLLKNEEGKILLLKRSAEKYGKTDGRWDIVGGRIEPGSSLIENLRREVQEETGLTIVSTPKLIAAQDILLESRHVVRLTYTAHSFGEVVLDTDENSEHSWLTFEELAAAADLDKYVRELFETSLLTADSWD